MKKYYFLFIFFSFFANSQISILKDVAVTGHTPIKDNQFWQNNKWNGQHYYFVVAYPSLKLVVTDGTNAGTTVVKDLGFTGTATASIRKMIPVQDFFYFHVNFYDFSAGVKRDELWKSDGTSAGTVMVKQFDNMGVTSQGIEIGNEVYDYTNSSILGNEMYFMGYSTANGLEMWKTDGTTAGTVMVKDIYTGTVPNYKGAQGFARLGTDVYFFSGYYLMKTDGTAAGTVHLNVPGLVIYANHRLQTFKNKLYFIGYDSTNGMELWQSDGTVSGTNVFKITSDRTDYTYVYKPFMLNKTSNYLIFQQLNNTNTSNQSLTLWRTDGTVNGTVAISPFDAIDGGFASNDVDYTMTENGMYIYNGASKNILFTNYQSDGYRMVPHPTGGQVGGLCDFFGTLWMSSGTFYSAGNNDFSEPWRSDAVQILKAFDLNTTTQGTNQNGSNPFGFFVLNGNLHFFANPNATGTKLYKFIGDYTFNNSVNGNWNNPSNWNSGLAPLSTDNATIPSGFNVTVDANSFANNLQITSPINVSTGNLSVNGNLNLGAKITLNGNNLNLKGSTSQISNGNATNYIVTNGTGTVNVENLNTARGTVNLPIGTSTNYNPISIANSGTSDTFSAKVSDGINNTTNGAVNATWDISETTSGGSNVNLSLGWNASQHNGTFTTSSAKVGHYMNSTWTEETSGSITGTNPYQITATGITSFSPFSVMNFGSLGTVDFSKSEISVYPNPFNDILNVEMKENAMINFYDISGKLVGMSMLSRGKNQLRKSELLNGVYIYQIINKDGKIIDSGKLIKK